MLLLLYFVVVVVGIVVDLLKKKIQKRRNIYDSISGIYYFVLKWKKIQMKYAADVCEQVGMI